MEKKLLYFESKSIDLLNHNIPQTLLIHASLFNADYLKELAKMIQKYGYIFISQEEVLKSTEYNTLIKTYSKKGVSWIFRWGISEGLGNGFMQGDVTTPKKIIELAKQ
ncbi:polysaccharide deacetylase family protein [Maribacter dokdonensis]|uniref:hypothetical protein n=1 Tax=Maribacter dokdonensis TaxID=320912 RepID=UPI000B8A49F3|nr:hypothetical protein [Maribacter dokdonensis]